MAISFEGIGEVVATFANDATNPAGCGNPCTIVENGTVALSAERDRFAGVVIHTRGGKAAVQLKGYVSVAYIGGDPDLGWCRLVADGEGGVKIDITETGNEYLVVDVDPDNQIVGFML